MRRVHFTWGVPPEKKAHCILLTIFYPRALKKTFYVSFIIIIDGYILYRLLRIHLYFKYFTGEKLKDTFYVAKIPPRSREQFFFWRSEARRSRPDTLGRPYTTRTWHTAIAMHSAKAATACQQQPLFNCFSTHNRGYAASQPF